MSLTGCKIIEFPQVSDPRGNLSFIESERAIPFPIRRVYYLYDMPFGAERGGHAHKKLQQLIIALSGSFNVTLDDGVSQKTFHLNCPYEGLYICPMVWREIKNFTSGAVSLVLASEYYDESDYCRDYQVFLKTADSGKINENSLY